MKRKPYLDLARMIAIAAVVLLHTLSGVLSQYISEMSDKQVYVYSILKILCSFCVPMFIMISGTLFLNPNKKVTLRELFGKYIRRLVLALLLFGTVYAEMELWFEHGGFRLSDLPCAIGRVLTGETWAHMWYLYMLIGLYMIMPILKGFIAASTKETQLYILILMLVFCSILPTAYNYVEQSFGIEIPIHSIYIFYFIAGYYCSEYVKITSKQKVLCMALQVVSIVSIIALLICRPETRVNYNHPLIVLFSVSMFVLLSGIKTEYEWCRRWNSYVFGIYLVHTFFLNLFYKALHITPLLAGGYVLLPVFFLVTFVLSFITVWGLRKIPFMRKWVL